MMLALPSFIRPRFRPGLGSVSVLLLRFLRLRARFGGLAIARFSRFSRFRFSGLCGLS